MLILNVLFLTPLFSLVIAINKIYADINSRENGKRAAPGSDQQLDISTQLAHREIQQSVT